MDQRKADMDEQSDESIHGASGDMAMQADERQRNPMEPDRTDEQMAAGAASPVAVREPTDRDKRGDQQPSFQKGPQPDGENVDVEGRSPAADEEPSPGEGRPSHPEPEVGEQDSAATRAEPGVGLAEPSVSPGPGVTKATAERNGGSPLLPHEQVEEWRAAWINIQAGFVDEPRSSVERADQLVEQVTQHLTRTLADQRSKLVAQWSQEEGASTEDLRNTLRHYRQFFDALLKV